LEPPVVKLTLFEEPKMNVLSAELPLALPDEPVRFIKFM